MKTVAQILKKTKPGDMLTNGKLYWKVNSTKFDGCIVASPVNKKGESTGRGFEIWSSGIENVATIPGLKVLK